MKPSIDTIAEFLDKDILDLARSARDKMGSYEHNELTIKDAYPQLKLLLDQLKVAIDKAYLERVSVNRRTNIGAHLTNIVQALDIFNQYDYESNYQTKHYQSQYIQAIYGLKDAVDDAKLFEMAKSYGNYYASTEKLSATENQYQELLDKIVNTEGLYEAAYNRLHILNEKIDAADIASEKLDNLTSIGIKNEAKIDDILNNAKEYIQDIEDRRIKVESFHKNVESMEESVEKFKDDNLNNINANKKNMQDLSEMFFSKDRFCCH